MSFMKELVNGVTKKFEVFETFFHDKQKNLDYKTRLDEEEIEDMAYLHTLHEYMILNWKYKSPIYGYLQRKKALRVSLEGLGRKEMQDILKNEILTDEEGQRKTTMDKMMGT